ncbi:MAG TPA: response regulator [Ktedonobacteraceae bacterium]|nr:response regulator [Ktedonobacteraceae bacterium]
MNKVVIIDDSLVVRKIVETTFKRAGIPCTGYRDGIEALQALRSWQDELPDLIFLDIGLPKIDGYDVLRLLKASPHFDQTAVIMLSAHDGVLDRLKSRLAGARGHITKPFKIQELLSVVP